MIPGKIGMSIFEKKIGVENRIVLYHPVLNKELVLIPILASNKDKLIASIPAYVDSLRNEGYAIYYPSLQFNFNEDSLVVDTLQRKYRKIAQSSYDYKYLYSLVFGTKFKASTLDKLGVSDSADFLIDWYMNDLLRAFELKAGKIVLDSCDWNTTLFEEYHCDKGKEGAALAIEKHFREEALFHQVLTAPHDKMAVIFQIDFDYYFVMMDLLLAGFDLKNSKI